MPPPFVRPLDAQAGLLKNLVDGRLYVACVSVNPKLACPLPPFHDVPITRGQPGWANASRLKTSRTSANASPNCAKRQITRILDTFIEREN